MCRYIRLKQKTQVSELSNIYAKTGGIISTHWLKILVTKKKLILDKIKKEMTFAITAVGGFTFLSFGLFYMKNYNF